jgi:MFS family permease
VRRPEEVWLFYLIGFAQAAVGTFFDPAKSALLPSIVERDSLLAANGLSQTTRVITSVIGAALAGVLVSGAGGAWPAFTLDALTFFVSAIFIGRIVAPRHVPTSAPGGVRATANQLMDGLKYLVGQQLLVGVLVVFR